MKPLSIAISLNNTNDSEQMVRANGIAQNAKFLYDILRLMGHAPYFLTSKPATGSRIQFGAAAYRAYTFAEILAAQSQTQVILEVGLSVNQEQRDQFRKQFSAKIVSVRFGHSMFMDMEQICYPETMTPGLYVNRPDAVWASPHFTKAFSYWETIYQAPVSVCPYLWEPDFVHGAPKSKIKAVPDIYVMEPNISFLKNALIPMTIIERVYRSAPDSFGKAMILNSLHYNNRPYFLDNIVKNFSCFISEAQKAFFTGRYTFDQVFKERDILLGHQNGCELNYLYLEALFQNIPLVHNSPALSEVGFYYPDFDVEKGEQALNSAIEEYARDSSGTKEKTYLRRFSIKDLTNQATYQQLLDKLTIL